MESLSSIIAEQVLPYLSENVVHIRLSIQNKQKKNKIFNHIVDVYIPTAKIPCIIHHLQSVDETYFYIYRRYGTLQLGGSRFYQILESELAIFLEFPFKGPDSVQNQYRDLVNKTIENSFTMYILYSDTNRI